MFLLDSPELLVFHSDPIIPVPSNLIKQWNVGVTTDRINRWFHETFQELWRYQLVRILLVA